MSATNPSPTVHISAASSHTPPATLRFITVGSASSAGHGRPMPYSPNVYRGHHGMGLKMKTAALIASASKSARERAERRLRTQWKAAAATAGKHQSIQRNP